MPLHNPACHETCYIDQATLELTKIFLEPMSASWRLRLRHVPPCLAETIFNKYKFYRSIFIHFDLIWYSYFCVLMGEMELRVLCRWGKPSSLGYTRAIYLFFVTRFLCSLGWPQICFPTHGFPVLRVWESTIVHSLVWLLKKVDRWCQILNVYQHASILRIIKLCPEEIILCGKNKQKFKQQASRQECGSGLWSHICA